MTARPEARRITGPHLLDDRTGAALDVVLTPDAGTLVHAWESAARDLLDAVGWRDERTRVRRFPGGANLFASAPPDSLYAATDLVELAWDRAAGQLADIASQVDRLRERIGRERNPRLVALAAEAERRGRTFLHDDDGVSLGSGSGVRLWRQDELPSPTDVDWDAITEIPIALVTGSNGKTTTVRLAAAIGTAAGHRVGYTSTDGVVVDCVPVVDSDYAGPMGARMVLRDSRVTAAILETARGGILRRGLAVRRASAAMVTNIGEDHFGDFGVQSLDDLADAKLVVARAVADSGYLVLNAGDRLLRSRGVRLDGRIVWFAADPALLEGLGSEASVAAVDGHVVARRGSVAVRISPVADIPATLNGAATHNVENALGAVALVAGLPGPQGQVIPIEAMRDGLTAFESGAADNAGRGNLLEVDGVRILVDYAHNADALAAVARVAGTITARRRLLLIGQAGDRTDDAIRGLARAAWALGPDLLLVKELDEYRRGREPGEVPRLIVSELERLGVPRSRYEVVPDELAAVRRALDWARRGDLLLLLVHEKRAEVMRLLHAEAEPAQKAE